MNDVIKCYISGRPRGSNPRDGIVSFAVPEFGLMFRCGAVGSRTELEIISFLSFLKFAQHNRDIFKGKEMRIFTDFPMLMYIMNNGAATARTFKAVVDQANKLARGLKVRVQWIDPAENRAAGAMVNIPDMPADAKIKIKTMAAFNIEKPTDIPGGPKNNDIQI